MPPDEAPETSSALAAEDAESVSPEDVRRLAHQARLSFSEEETEQLAGDLSRLLGYAQKLHEVDTAGVAPMAPGALAAPQHLRTDEPEKPLSQAEALQNAPDAADGFFRLPGVL